MQTALAQRTVFTTSSVRASGRVSARGSAVVVRASAEESRRAVLGGLVGAALALTASKATASPQNIELFDDRKARDTGFDLIYEARDLDLPQATRDGFTQARTSLADTKKRIAEAETRLDGKLADYVKKQYWTLGREELRLQLGTLRFDLNAVAEATGSKAAKKNVQGLSKEFFKKADALDYAMRQKSLDKAVAALEAAKTSLDSVVAVL